MTIQEMTYAPLSEARVVSQLIRERSQLDPGFIAGLSQMENVSGVASDGVPVVLDDVVCTYADLDTLIDTCGLSASERFTVGELMKGYGFTDIAEEFGGERQTYYTLFKRAVEKIVSANNLHWEEVYADRAARGILYF